MTKYKKTKWYGRWFNVYSTTQEGPWPAICRGMFQNEAEVWYWRFELPDGGLTFVAVYDVGEMQPIKKKNLQLVEGTVIHLPTGGSKKD